MALLAVAIATKIAAGYAGAKLVGFTKDTSLAIGFLMNGRGMVELVIATIGFASGILDSLFNSRGDRIRDQSSGAHNVEVVCE